MTEDLIPRKDTAMDRRICGLLIAAHVALSVYLSWNLNIWLDECFSMNTSGQGLAYALQQSLRFELQPPIYFLVLSVWRSIHESVFFARLLSLLISVSTLLVMRELARRWVPQIAPGWVLATLALNPIVVWASSEIRVYALILLLASLLLLLLYDGFLSDSPSPRARWLYGLVSVVALYTQYYLGFLLVAHATALVATRRWRALIAYLAVMAAVAVCLIPIVWIIPGQITDHASAVAPPASLLRAVWLIAHHAQEMVLPVYSVLGRRWLAMMGGVALAAAVALFLGRRHIGDRQLALWSLALTAIAALSALVVFAGPEVVTRRHVSCLFPIAALLPFSLLTIIEPGRRRLVATVAWVAVVTALTLFSLQRVYGPMAKDGDMIRVAEFIMERESEGQPILVFPREHILPLQYYYEGPNAVVPVPRPPDFTKYDLQAAVLEDEDQIAEVLAQQPGEHDEIWLVFTMWPGHDVYLGVDFNAEAMESFIQRGYRRKASRSFLGAEVMLLAKKRTRR